MTDHRARVTLTADVSQFNTAMERAVAALQRVDWYLLAAAIRRHQMSARPAPLCIDGHAYARRRRARVRRR